MGNKEWSSVHRRAVRGGFFFVGKKVSGTLSRLPTKYKSNLFPGPSRALGRYGHLGHEERVCDRGAHFPQKAPPLMPGQVHRLGKSGM